ncbi:tRNA glutamyl-Q(34) synthetase GluQRS [soil metagenome]
MLRFTIPIFNFKSSILNSMITRLAPTPSGYLHQGNAFNFLLNWLMAREQGGKVLLRIDDLDVPRSKQEYLHDVFETLDWLGIDWDAGPAATDDLAASWSQSLRLPLYNSLLEQLRAQGHLFACDCSRKSLAAAGGVYQGNCIHKGIPFDQPDVAWRVKVNVTETISFNDGWQGETIIALGLQVGSFVVRRRDGIPAYQIASLADDVHYGITSIARGMDLLSSTASQLYLAKLLGLGLFTQTLFYHHPLLLDQAGHKLSKSTGSLSLHHWRKEGISASVLLANFCKWTGLAVQDPLIKAKDILPHWRSL